MLQQILDDMFIDPELLGELSEEQKQILFCKMREEQIRKWEHREAELLKEESVKGTRECTTSRKGHHVGFRTGTDGKPWVWVMGEHSEDMSMDADQKLEAEAKEKLVSNLHSLKAAREQELLSAQREYDERREAVAWREQERRAKEAETQRRSIARHAREEYRRNSLRNSTSPTATSPPVVADKPKLGDNNNQPTPPPPLLITNGTSTAVTSSPPAERPIKPPNREAVIDWFKKEERPKGIGVNPATKNIEPWFHGIISRSEAEALLQDKPIGSFLVRVSERVWGYAVSYKAAERCKHFLVDSTDGLYQFFGTEQILHGSLAELISHHMSKPISLAGQEFLREPCGQAADTGSSHDYQELFLDETTEITFV